MENQIFRLNALRTDFMKWAGSDGENKWKVRLNEIGGQLSAFGASTNPTVILDSNEDKWYLSVSDSNNVVDCYPIEDLSLDQVHEIRRIIETWLARKDVDFFNM
jgi:hypothetical protein